jgi:ribosomal protein L11 methyltransferase
LRWVEVSVEVPAEAEEAVADLLRAHVQGGVAVEEGPTGTLVVKGYLPADRGLQRREATLRRLLAAYAGPSTVSTRWLEEKDWAHAWKEFFPVLRVGERLVICPAWRSHEAQKGEAVVRLDPGLAFGTGQHPTTRMCLLALEEMVRPAMTVLDLGCGSGILALAAARLGAASVLALDDDAQAVVAARENVRLNDLQATVQVEEGSLPLDPPSARSFDLVMANISGPVIIELARAISDVPRPGGVLFATGFSANGLDEVSAALIDAGLSVERTVEDDEWRSVVARRA